MTADKAVAATDIRCNGSTTVTLTLGGETGIAGDPADIVLVLDRSGSMNGQPLAQLKSGAGQFVDIVDEATDGQLNGTVANGSRVAVVSFADNATVNQPLTSGAAAVKSAVNSLGAGGGTNHSAAISTARGQLAGGNTNDIMILFTDGMTTVGGSADDEAVAARAAGIEIFVIGLGDVNHGELNDWASDPDSGHVFIAPNPGQLSAIFQAIGAAVVSPAATAITVTVTDAVNGHFTVTNPAASRGSVAQAGNVLTWTIPALQTESATLSYTITHNPALPGGAESVGSTAYSDAEGRALTFPNSAVNVRGCAATIDVTPPSATNELGAPGQGSHTVTGTVRDDFGDPVDGVQVDFSVVSGPNAGATGSGTTAGGAGATFTYPGTQGNAGRGQDTVQGCFVNGAGTTVCDTATKDWVDTTPPVVQCGPTTNPSGNNVPSAGNNPRSGQNPDGFYVLTATDVVDAGPTITVSDSGSPATFGPFPSDTRIKLTQAPGSTPDQKPGPGGIDWHITLKGDARITATDASGNTSAAVSCLVPPGPK